MLKKLLSKKLFRMTLKLNVKAEIFSVVFFVLSAIWMPTAKAGPWSGYPHSPNVNHTVIIRFPPEGYQKPRNEVGSLSLVEYSVGYEPKFSDLISKL